MRYAYIIALLVYPCISSADNIDPAFGEYYNRFMEASFYYKVQVSQDELIIKFGIPSEGQASNPDKIRLASCTIGGGLPATVIVRKDRWNKFSDLDREELIFHELGHCLLKRRHKDDKTSTGNPVSIMHHEHMGGERYGAYKEYYERELFWGHFRPVITPNEL